MNICSFSFCSSPSPPSSSPLPLPPLSPSSSSFPLPFAPWLWTESCPRRCCGHRHHGWRRCDISAARAPTRTPCTRSTIVATRTGSGMGCVGGKKEEGRMRRDLFVFLIIFFPYSYFHILIFVVLHSPRGDKLMAPRREIHAADRFKVWYDHND